MFTETLVSPALGRELTCLLNDAHPGKYSGIRPKSIYSGESTLAAVVGETFESFLQIQPASSGSRALLAFYLRGARGGMNVVIHSWSQYAACRVRFLQRGGGGEGGGGSWQLGVGQTA